MRVGHVRRNIAINGIFKPFYILIKDNSLIDEVIQANQKFSLLTPYLHITLHYPFTIKEGFSEEDVFRILTRFLSQFNAPTFSIQNTLWLHKNRYANGNIIALEIERSGEFEKIRIGLTNALHPYIVATDFFRN